MTVGQGPFCVWPTGGERPMSGGLAAQLSSAGGTGRRRDHGPERDANVCASPVSAGVRRPVTDVPFDPYSVTGCRRSYHHCSVERENHGHTSYITDLPCTMGPMQVAASGLYLDAARRTISGLFTGRMTKVDDNQRRTVTAAGGWCRMTALAEPSQTGGYRHGHGGPRVS